MPPNCKSNLMKTQILATPPCHMSEDPTPTPIKILQVS